ncbi:FtsX-like permease family protein [Actinomyces oris]|uniref:FtsX-like permease family protein n=1 Tax=Actinomyces oris TaxID=544580 RepID=UPI000B227137|nr:FtsX-like permease family protein [Actinomyces oris]
MTGSLIIIASTVLGIFIYVLTLQKRPVLGILKARGVPTSYLIRSGCAQTLVLSVVGIGVGLLLTLTTSLVLPRAVPFRISAPLDLLIVTAFIVISVIGGFISVRVISRIDPVEAIS